MRNHSPTLSTAVDLVLEQVDESTPPASISEAIGLINLQLHALSAVLVLPREDQDADALLQHLTQIAASVVSATAIHVLPILEEEESK
jgi:hypothetical protein